MTKVAPVEHAEKARVSNGSGGSGEKHRDSSRGSIVLWSRHIARDFFLRSGWYDSAVAVSIRKFLRGRLFAIVTMISLVVALFFGELWAIIQVPTNSELDIILTIVFAVFAFEFVGLACTDASYLLGFFFWMDLLGTASMVFDISFLLGTDVSEPHRVNRLNDSQGSENVIVVRAARAAKLGARAGRISRVLKILRFLPFLFNSEEKEQMVKMAKVISNQLTNVLSTRVAFLTICIVIVVPVFGMFTYPEVDDSMSVWTVVLNANAKNFYDAYQAGDSARTLEATENMTKEVIRFRDFYTSLSYGPFSVRYGVASGDSASFRYNDDELVMTTPWDFSSPRRKSSIRIVTQDRVEAHFDLSTPRQQEAAASIGLICFIIFVMCVFGMVMSSSISKIALQPLERMLSVVRERCTEIFKYTHDLEDEENEDADDENEEYDDTEQSSEFVLLEKVVGKLAAIAHLSTTNQEPEVKANMNENELMVLNWMQGAQVAAGAGRNSTSQKPDLSSDSLDVESHMAPSSAIQIPAEILDEMESGHFDTCELAKDLAMSVAYYMVTQYEGCSAWVRANVREDNLRSFISQCDAGYVPNPFHNFSHALDVQYTVFTYMKLIEADRYLNDTSQFWLMIAAIGHDVGHLGVNNQYLVETAHELALRYNDRSPLENMHCAKLFQILSNPEANVFSQVEKDLYKEMRKGIIAVILHTDVTKHNEMIKELGMLYQMNSETFDALEPGPAITQSHANTQLVLNALLHCADVGNPMKPWEVCQKLAYLCLDEFFAQGDLEKAAGIPVQMLNDRDKVNRPNSQVGFIEFVIAPMVETMVNIFPQLDGLAYHLGENIQKWCDIWQEEHSPSPEAVTKVRMRAQKVAEKCGALMRPED